MLIKKKFSIIICTLVFFVIATFFSFFFHFSRYKQNSEFQSVLNNAHVSLEKTKLLIEEFLINPEKAPYLQLQTQVEEFKTNNAFIYFERLEPKHHIFTPLLKKKKDFIFIIDLLLKQKKQGFLQTPLYEETSSQVFLISHEISSLMRHLSIESNKKIIRDTWATIGAFSISTALACFMFFIVLCWGKKNILGRIEYLDKSSCRISKCDYTKKIDSLGNDELTDLAKSFNTMQNSIQNHVFALKQEKKRLATILFSIGDAVIAVDKTSTITLINPVAEELTGWMANDAIGKNLDEIFTIVKEKSREKQINPVKTVLETGQKQILKNHTILLSQTGKEYPIADSAAPIRLLDGTLTGVVLVFRDVTEQKRLQDILVQSEKMLSVGGLAAGMAHEINNPLSGMIQTASVLHIRLSQDLPANKKAAEKANIKLENLRTYMDSRGIYNMLDMINESGTRIGKIVNNMLSFARKGSKQMSSHNLLALIDHSIELASSDYNMKKKYAFNTINIERDYPPSFPLIPCNSSQIEQVLLNLLRNGAQAFFDAKTQNPCISIKIYADSIKNMACIEVKDNGPGIKESVKRRVFEPFYTTKSVGEGTGLGLSVSYFIITENHMGEMEVFSAPKKGATFTVRLPFGQGTNR
ncbi:MAG TPA: ATP-binding protein [Treponemataceae bacterium]|nr:ATP-binding protein [Treponemataceae bacterium]